MEAINLILNDSEVKSKPASGVVTLKLPSRRAFAANEPRWHRGCSDCSYDGVSERIVYNHFRYYDPSTGRYIQSDRIGLADGPNTYLYVHANPLIGFDPNGLQNVDNGRTSSGSRSNAQGKDDTCGCFEKAFLGYEELGVAAAGAATGPFTTKPRTGISGGGPSGDRTSFVSKGVSAVNRRFGKNSFTRGLRTFGRLVSRAVPGAGTVLAIYDSVIYEQCLRDCDDCQK